MKKLERYEMSDFGYVPRSDGDVCKSEDVSKLEAQHAQLQAKYDQLMETLRLVTTNMKHTTQPVWNAQKDEWDMTYEYRLPTLVGRQVSEVYDRIFIKEFQP